MPLFSSHLHGPLVPSCPSAESLLAGAREEFAGTQGVPRSVREGRKAEEEA